MTGAFQTMLGGGDPGGGTRFVKLDTLNSSLAVGQEGRLVGITTGALIGTFRKTASGLKAIGEVYPYQADGPELIGTIGLTAEGGAGEITWGTPGSRTTGGFTIPNGGTIGLVGFAPLLGWTRSVRSRVYLQTRQTAPATGDALWTGTKRPAAVVGALAGFGWSGAAWGNGCALAGARDAPTLTYLAFTDTPPTEAAECRLAVDVFPSNTVATTCIVYGGYSRPGERQGQQVLNGVADQASNDHYPIWGRRGAAWVARVVEFQISGYIA